MMHIVSCWARDFDAHPSIKEGMREKARWPFSKWLDSIGVKDNLAY